MTGEAPYYVWRRSDGYVGCTRYMPRQIDFTLIATTDTWDEARTLLVCNRDERHHALVATWDSPPTF